jgi:hypothetical protein
MRVCGRGWDQLGRRVQLRLANELERFHSCSEIAEVFQFWLRCQSMLVEHDKPATHTKLY